MNKSIASKRETQRRSLTSQSTIPKRPEEANAQTSIPEKKSSVPNNNTRKESNPSMSRNNSRTESGRQFLVTHTSDNWKIRKISRQASTDQIIGDVSETNKQPNGDATAAMPNFEATEISQAPRRFGKSPIPESSESTEDPSPLPSKHSPVLNAETDTKEPSVEDFLLRIKDREKTILPGVDSLKGELSPRLGTKSASNREGVHPARTIISRKPGAANNAVSNSAINVNNKKIENGDKNHVDEGFDTDDADVVKDSNVGSDDDRDKIDDAFGNNDERSSGFSEAPPRQRKILTSKDFDTDFSESDDDSDDSSREKTKEEVKSRYMKTYGTSCAKCHLTPNPTFTRQLGQVSVDIRNRMLTFKEAKPIAIALVTDRKTSFLDMSDNPLGPLGTAYIAEMMFANRSIMELNLSNTQPGREGLSALVQTLRHNSSLRRLFLNDNGLNVGDGEVLADLITDVPDLRELYLKNNNLGSTDIKKIALAIASNKGKLSVLNLQYNNIRMDGAIQMALALARNKTLRSLNVGWNGFGTEGCRALAMSLNANTTLQELDLTSNRLVIKSLEFLIKGLSKNKGLTCLRVGRNSLTTAGVKALIVAITQATDSTLTELDLEDIPIDQEFLDLTEKLKSTRVIRVLHDSTVHLATTDQTKDHDGTNLDRFDPVMVLFEYMKKDNLRVIDLFQFFDAKKREKLSRKDLRTGLNILMIPFTEHAIDVIMKSLDTNKDGFITLEEMTKGYQESDRAVKLRRIKANKKGKKDNGLEDLWTILKGIIAKRKEENEKRSANNTASQSKTGS